LTSILDSGSKFKTSPISFKNIDHNFQSTTILPESNPLLGDSNLASFEEELSNKVLKPKKNIKTDSIVIRKLKIKPDEVPLNIENTWQRNAVVLDEMPPGPQIAIVIDDAGIDRKSTASAIALPAPITIAFLTYGRELKKQVNFARNAGHEILVHLSMEPVNKTVDPGPGVLLINSSRSQILKHLRWGLGRFDGYVGINNHMGSRFTSDPIGMGIVMEELKKRGLLFLDSRTSSETVGASMALVNDVPYTERNIFLDNIPTVEAVNKQLQIVELFARRNGYAVAIGHPRKATIVALSQWLAVMAEKGFVQVPISTIVQNQYKKTKLN
jgi:polysaccharide deacetylase 2 family uncharacterized protein YibQ